MGDFALASVVCSTEIVLRCMEAETLEAALKFLSGTFKGVLASMSSEEKRSGLIADLNSVTSYSVSELEAMPTNGTLGSLIGLAAISGSLLNRNTRTSSELLSMSYEDQTNTIISTLTSTPLTRSTSGKKQRQYWYRKQCSHVWLSKINCVPYPL